MEEQKILQLPILIASNLGYGWTFLLLLSRYMGLFIFAPGLAMGIQGLELRIPAMMIISLATLSSTPILEPPEDLALLLSAILAELVLGSILGMLPTLIVAGAQTAGQFASTTMGLGAGQLIDPTLQTQTNQISRIMGDLLIIAFIILDGHHILLYAISGVNQQLVPGSFVINSSIVDVLTRESGMIFKFALIASAPIVSALLLTQLILGIITKFVQQVNVFIISFPLTIGLGMVILVMVLPMFARIGSEYISGIESNVMSILDGVKKGV